MLGHHDLPPEHVQAARAVVPLAALINTALPGPIRRLISPQVSTPSTTIGRRFSALTALKEVHSNVSKYRSAWADRLPAGSPARNINLPLLRVLVRRFDYADKEITNDISRGMPIAGDFPTRPVLASREKAATDTMENWTKNLPGRNKRAIGRVHEFRPTELGDGRWGNPSVKLKPDGRRSQPR